MIDESQLVSAWKQHDVEVGLYNHFAGVLDRGWDEFLCEPCVCDLERGVFGTWDLLYTTEPAKAGV
jgi:hypothetical protein